MSLDLSAAIATFVTESNELLQDMESSLVDLDSDPTLDSDEIVNSVFRAIHTIKGSAGIFGFDLVVELSHVAETVLDEIRTGTLHLTSELVTTYLSCRDVLAELIELEAKQVEPDAALSARTQELIRAFEDISQRNDEQNTAPHPAQHNVAQAKNLGNRAWYVLYRPNENVLRDGLDPFSFINFMAKSVDNITVFSHLDNLFNAQPFDAESCYLEFILKLEGDVTHELILDVFEFTLNEAIVQIIPPNADLDAFKTSVMAFNNTEFVSESLDPLNDFSDPVLDLLEHDENQVEVPDEAAIHNPLKDPAEKAKTKIHVSNTLRVEALKLDELINQVGEMVITGARTNLLAHETGNEPLMESMALLERLVENIRDSSLKLRMVQIGETFNKFKRVVRDIAQELEKDVELEIIGADTELDKTFVEKVSDPLMHIVRNAIDHGLESPDVREQAGKPRQGTLTLKAYHDSGSIVIEVKDDGKGLNLEKILARAKERGLVANEQVLGKKDIQMLIFEPGFSTAETVTNLSGRGVGMDVVKRNIDSLRGSVEIESEQGAGTTILIRLPLTLSIIDGFMFEVNDESYVIPLDTVVECLELHEVAQAQDTKSKSYINLRTEVLPFIRLRTLFGITDPPPQERESLIIVQFGNLRAGLVVDSLKGEFQTVVKPLGRLFEGLKCISGATILGSGKVSIILDVSALIKTAVSIYESIENQTLSTGAQLCSKI